MEEINVFIKRNIPKVKMTVKYNDDNNVYTYKFNSQGIDFKLLFTETENNVSLSYDSKTITDFNDIQLELFDILNYKTLEYLDAYIIKKSIEKEIVFNDMYNDYYDDQNQQLICNRSLTFKNGLTKKFVINIYENTDYILNYNLESIEGFDNVLAKITEILEN
jgi:hypothetical protein